jgi:HEPN domain-containing protein
MNERVKYWIEISEYDLETAEAMFQTKRYLYVGFMCHQSIEKILKALYSKLFEDVAPYTHSLNYLAKKVNIIKDMDETMQSFIDDLEPLNIDSRYPRYKEQIRQLLTEDKCIEILQNTKDLFQWIKMKL